MKIYYMILFTIFATLSEACRDSTYRFRYNGKFRSCDFVARHNTAFRCEFFGVKFHCPQTCSTCNICGDSPIHFKIVSEESFFYRSCQWVRNQDTENRCLINRVKFECPVTCGTACPYNNCEDREGRFKIVTSTDRVMKRSCEWVQKKDTSARCNIPGVAELCKETCGLCS